jgi:hypothetical protein
MGGACSIKRRDAKCIQNFGQKKLKGRDHLDDLGIDGKIISEQLLGK